MSGLTIPEAAVRDRMEQEARKVFRVKVALEVLGNEDLHKLAATAKEGAATAHALIKRANEVMLSYMNEDK